MKIKLALLVLCFNSVFNLAEAQPTLEETLSWIKGKLDSQMPFEKSDTIRTLIDGETVSRRVERYVYKNFEFRYSGCEIQYQSQYETYSIVSSAFQSHQEFIQKVNLKDIEEASWLSENEVALYTVWDQHLVKSWTPVGFLKDNEPEDYFRETEKDAHYVNVIFLYSTIPLRLKKAFNHAIKLCGGGAKKEKF